jgi:hypothetical protein
MFRLYDQPFPEGDYRYVQISHVVTDVVAAAWDWVDLHGAGPFLLLPPADFEAPYRGGVTRLRYRIGVTQLGPMQVELIEVLDDSPSYFRDMYAPGEAGPHHLSSVTSDFDGALAHYTARGFEPVSVFGSSAGRVAYVDTRPATGLFTEILEQTDVMLHGLRKTAAICATWDGTDPVRVFSGGRGYDVPPRPTTTKDRS